jgi:hypothetical protein
MQNQDPNGPRGRHAVPPVSPDTGTNSPQGKESEKDGGLSRGNSLDQPSTQPNRPDQLGKTDCQPGGSDRGGSLTPGPSTPGQPGEPPVLLPPAGSSTK